MVSHALCLPVPGYDQHVHWQAGRDCSESHMTKMLPKIRFILDNQLLFEAHLQDISWKGGSVCLTITSILRRLPVARAGDKATIRSAIAVAVTTAPLVIATTTTLQLLIQAERLPNVLCEFLGSGLVQHVTVRHCYHTLLHIYYIITSTITTYYYDLYFYLVNTSFLHIITLPIIMYF